MFVWYKDLLEKIFGAIFEKSGETVGFMDYLSVLGLSLLFALMALVLIAVLVGAAAGPFCAHRKLFASVKRSMKSFDQHSTLDALNALKRKLWTRRVIYWGVFAFVYVPVIIPTILYILSLVVSLFA